MLKGASEQYVIDYFKTFGVDRYRLHQSCIYGHNQFGIEDQGWIAWMILCFLSDKKIKVFGDGKQVRDILHINDLLELFNIILKNLKFLPEYIMWAEVEIIQ